MNTPQEAVVLGFLGHFTGGDWPDIDVLVSSFSPDCVNYVLYPTTKPVIGRDKLKEELVRQAKTSQTPRADIKAYASNGTHCVRRAGGLVCDQRHQTFGLDEFGVRGRFGQPDLGMARVLRFG